MMSVAVVEARRVAVPFQFGHLFGCLPLPSGSSSSWLFDVEMMKRSGMESCTREASKATKKIKEQFIMNGAREDGLG